MELGIRLSFVNTSEFRRGGLNPPKPPRYATWKAANYFTTTCLEVDRLCLEINKTCLEVNRLCLEINKTCFEVNRLCLEINKTCLEVNRMCLEVKKRVKANA
jgi:hypothetical protein